MFELVAPNELHGAVAILKDNLRGPIEAVEGRLLPGRQVTVLHEIRSKILSTVVPRNRNSSNF
jgi:hypothetical protein